MVFVKRQYVHETLLMLDIKIIEGAGCTEFREYLLRCPSTLIYMEPRFLDLVCNHLDAACSWVIARREGAITGLLPFLIKNGPLGPAYNSLAYYGSNGGVIQDKNDLVTKIALIDTFYETAAQAKAVSATIITNPLEGDVAFYNDHIKYDYRDERIGQITHFPASSDELFGSFDDPRPRNIRRAIKEGITIARGGAESFQFLYQTHVDNMTAIGGIAKKKEFFDFIPTRLDDGDWAVFTALLDGKPIAALLLLYFNRTVEYFTPVIVDKYKNTQALSLVIYEAMRDAMQKKFNNWNWGGTWPSQRGVYDFKKRWRTSEYSYFYYTRVMNRQLTFCKPTFILDNYPGFFLIPFDRLNNL